jgi:hypothetical protein
MDIGSLELRIKEIVYKLEHDSFMTRIKRLELLSLLNELLSQRKILQTEKIKRLSDLADLLYKRGYVKLSEELGQMHDLNEYRNKKKFEERVGTISAGTLNHAHLILAFMEELEELLPEEAKKIYEENNDLFLKLAEGNTQNTEETGNLLWRKIVPLLEKLAPKGFYFGTTEDDSSNYGWWKTIENNIDDRVYREMSRENNWAQNKNIKINKISKHMGKDESIEYEVGDKDLDSGNLDQDAEAPDEINNEDLIIEERITDFNPGQDNLIINKME